MSILSQIQAHAPELLVFLAWIVHSPMPSAAVRDANRRLGLLALALAMTVAALRVFQVPGVHPWPATSTLWEWARVDRFSALFQFALSWSAFAAIAMRRQHAAVILGFTWTACLAVSSVHLFLTLAAVAAAFRFLAAAAHGEEPHRPPRLTLLVFVFAIASLALSCSALHYSGLSIGMSQDWLDQSAGGGLAAWTILSASLAWLGQWALRNSNQRSHQVSAAPVLLFAVWLRLTTALFAGVVEGSSAEVGNDTMRLVQSLVIVAALFMAIRVFKSGGAATSDLPANPWQARIAASVPLQVALWLIASVTLEQNAVTSAALAALVFALATPALMSFVSSVDSSPESGRGRRLATALWWIALLAWLGMPMTAGAHSRWLMLTSLYELGELWLVGTAAVISLVMMARLLPTAINGQIRSESRVSGLLISVAALLLVAGFLYPAFLHSLTEVGNDVIFW